jgi:aldehyde dehydrogenase (NAD+)
MIDGVQVDDLFETKDYFYIGGKRVEPSTSSAIRVIQPGTEELFAEVPEAMGEDINRAVAAAREAFDCGPWPWLTHVERAVYLRSIARGIRARSDELSRIWSSEMGILLRHANAAMSGIAGTFEYYANLAETFPFIERRRQSSGEGFAALLREPVGVVGAIIPWNGPMTLMAMKVAPALLAGCTVVVKSSPEAPMSAYVLADIAEEIGLPAGVLNVVTADREVSELLVKDERVDKISFTGSTMAGRRIASLCGERIARYTLELGGKSAAVVLDDYDLEKAAESLAASATVMTGQVCSALTRIIVSRERHSMLVDALSERFRKVKIGDQFDPNSDMGPLAMSRQLERVEGLISKGIQEGAALAVGGRRPPDLDRGYFIEPTVFANVDNSSAIARTEIFGPVLCVIPAENETQAVNLANESEFGLNSSVFTHDPDRAMYVARRLRAGTVGHNSKQADFGIAFGGFKRSGIGREGGREGLMPYLETKTVLLNTQPGEFDGD